MACAVIWLVSIVSFDMLPCIFKNNVLVISFEPSTFTFFLGCAVKVNSINPNFNLYVCLVCVLILNFAASSKLHCCNCLTFWSINWRICWNSLATFYYAEKIARKEWKNSKNYIFKYTYIKDRVRMYWFGFSNFIFCTEKMPSKIPTFSLQKTKNCQLWKYVQWFFRCQ